MLLRYCNVCGLVRSIALSTYVYMDTECNGKTVNSRLAYGPIFPKNGKSIHRYPDYWGIQMQFTESTDNWYWLIYYCFSFIHWLPEMFMVIELNRPEKDWCILLRTESGTCKGIPMEQKFNLVVNKRMIENGHLGSILLNTSEVDNNISWCATMNDKFYACNWNHR